MNERGSVSVLLAVCMAVVIGAGAIVIDAGQIWSSRRELVTAADAAAFAAAAAYAEYGDGCTSIAASYVAANTDSGSMASCTRTGSGTLGTVTVSVQETVNHQLASFLGRPSTNVDAASTVYFGAASGLTGLRPFGLCSESDGFQAWQASGHSTTQVFRIYYTKDSQSQCGGNVPGNWALIDFNGGSNTLSELRDWVANGYPGEVTVPTWDEGDPGSFSNSMDIHTIVGEEVYLPIFDNATGTGSNSSFHLVGFVSVIVHDYKANGSEANRYLDIQFTTAVATGTCCTGAVDGGLFAVGLCKVDNQGVCP